MAEEVEIKPTRNWALIKMRSVERPEYFEGLGLNLSIDDNGGLTLSTFDGELWSRVNADAYEWFKLYRGSSDASTVKADVPKEKRMTDYKRLHSGSNSRHKA